ncbi:hypothetical protein ACFLXE_05870 [Chloroflexota bacterium]
MEEEFINGLLSNLQCSRCGRHYDPASTSLLGYIEGLWIFYVYCPSCNILGFAVASTSETEVTEADIELTPTEKGRFSAAITSDDVINMHIFLKDFSGGFSSLFASK